MKKWGDQKIDVQRCGLAIVKANQAGKEIPMEFYLAMGKRFSVEEIEAIEAYSTMRTLIPSGIGADYMNVDEMNQKIEELQNED